jgi:hypothetical protein
LIDVFVSAALSHLEIAMTPYEYKAWFDSFTASDRKSPSLEKWALINDRVADIDGFPLTRKTYVDAFCGEPQSDALRQALSNHFLLDRMFNGEEAIRALGEVQALHFASNQPRI